MCKDAVRGSLGCERVFPNVVLCDGSVFLFVGFFSLSSVESYGSGDDLDIHSEVFQHHGATSINIRCDAVKRTAIKVIRRSRLS